MGEHATHRQQDDLIILVEFEGIYRWTDPNGRTDRETEQSELTSFLSLFQNKESRLIMNVVITLMMATWTETCSKIKQ
jgi:hypothetical protein